jgi:hypothetical protein
MHLTGDLIGQDLTIPALEGGERRPHDFLGRTLRRVDIARKVGVDEAGRIINRMKATLIRVGIRGFNPKLKRAAGRLEDLRTPEGQPIPPKSGGTALIMWLSWANSTFAICSIRIKGTTTRCARTYRCKRMRRSHATSNAQAA